MIATAEVPMLKFTENRILCPNCQRNNNFEIVIKQEGSKYYFGEKCPKCDHYDEFKEITRREALRYIILEDI